MLTAKLIMERLNKEGRVLERREQLSRSIVLQFLRLLYIKHTQANLVVTDISNTARTVDSSNLLNMAVAGPAGFSGIIHLQSATAAISGENIGIQVGTGTTAPTPTDYVMETRIDHGQAAGEFEYGGTELLALVISDPNGEFTIRRYFTNDSGGSITVNEVGIYAVASIADDSFYAFLAARDKVDPGVAVADGKILRVTYVPQITV
ncbi:unnamed protein product [marine sediment metagenome]|uniref:Uncharacterized protein n=1 Tax=marine sediment metagenome TaxID=412755 RepID=X1JTR7_9ZZZZ